jgi:dihydroorotate dehydrogenase (NAD+) catalytic subunit
MTGSGTFGFGPEMANIVDLNKLGAIVVKSTSLLPRLGNDTPRIAETPGGILNAIGLQNAGVDNFIKEKLPFLRQYDVPIIVNIVGTSVAEYCELAAKIEEHNAADALEVNISCPNVSHGCDFAVDPKLTFELISQLKKTVTLPLITKLSPNVSDIVQIAQAAVDAGSDSLSLINTLLGTSIDPIKRRFRIANRTGGLSGPCVKPVALRCVWQVHNAIPHIPLVGMGGIMTGLDAIEFFLAGASAVSVGTATFINPTASTNVLREIEDYCAEYGVENIADLVGSVQNH